MVSYPAEGSGGGSTERNVLGTNEGHRTLVGIKVSGCLFRLKIENKTYNMCREMSSMLVERRHTHPARVIMVRGGVFVFLFVCLFNLVFAGKEPNRALGKSSLKPEDCVSDYSTLSETETKTLNDWHTFFSKRYNIVGRLQPENESRI